MKNKEKEFCGYINYRVENLIKEVGIDKVETILKEMKSKVNIKENLKKDFIELLSGCTISFNNDNIEYLKDGELLFCYQKKDNCFNVTHFIWVNFTNKYKLDPQELKNLLIGIIDEVLNYKRITPLFENLRDLIE